MKEGVGRMSQAEVAAGAKAQRQECVCARLEELKVRNGWRAHCWERKSK